MTATKRHILAMTNRELEMATLAWDTGMEASAQIVKANPNRVTWFCHTCRALERFHYTGENWYCDVCSKRIEDDGLEWIEHLIARGALERPPYTIIVRDEHGRPIKANQPSLASRQSKHQSEADAIIQARRRKKDAHANFHNFMSESVGREDE